MELKRISRDYKLIVVDISSFNHWNYSYPVTMEVLKESGYHLTVLAIIGAILAVWK